MGKAAESGLYSQGFEPNRIKRLGLQMNAAIQPRVQISQGGRFLIAAGGGNHIGMGMTQKYFNNFQSRVSCRAKDCDLLLSHLQFPPWSKVIEMQPVFHLKAME
jgi:hypothetical protein